MLEGFCFIFVSKDDVNYLHENMRIKQLFVRVLVLILEQII